ncbi:hypothetical protein COY52_02450 [Candidatus Desantisbacteria bacterium CG_4_10_14_0_8_um_filter_48_22]|uniref:HTH lacI-type domain-containing protein n=1 Tax=Candidatus Desantisbacteria bacterium CG_4_10_14_0_8_um_filter_48_22 TaxID=1974543 RepID=A0A2M7SEB8_9BACT|nr:MAG: hypothetical protein AUJ67_02650 [Candidatus Desantisbacteria bacterium CG1_02_49_89]PIZ17858.1 MAG: hypothetical protein COY52_02450 [Candidatus Desantisbacteria bacterium CG_4_10_14_0_8_um_filter_48_22]
MSTIKEVAKLAGISPSAVSFVMNEKHKGEVSARTRLRVLKAVQKLNYHPNPYGRGLKLNKSDAIGYCVPRGRSILADPYYYEMLVNLEREARKHNYSLLFFAFDMDGGENVFKEVIGNSHVDGLIIEAPLLSNGFSLSQEIMQFPAVLIGKNSSKIFNSSVDVDDIRAGQKATEHLIIMGKKRICFIAGPSDIGNDRERLAGYRAALKENNIEPNPDLVINGDYSIQSGYSIMDGLIKNGLVPDGVVACNDLMAIGAMNFAKEKKFKIPQDIAVVGFNNTSLSQNYDPPLTIVSIPASQVASRAVEMLVKMLKNGNCNGNGHNGNGHNGNGRNGNGNGSGEKVVLDSELIVRESTMVGWWRFDRPEGKEVSDRSGKGRDAKIDGAVWVGRKRAAGLKFSRNAMVEIPHSETLNPRTGDWTVCAWVKTSQKPGIGEGDKVIVRKDKKSQSRIFWGLSMGGYDAGLIGKAFFQIWHEGKGVAYAFSRTLVNDNKWHFLAGVRDTGAKRIRIYVDGKLEGEEKEDLGEIAGDEALSFGNDASWREPHSCFNGIIREVKIFNSALKREEIFKSVSKCQRINVSE